MGFSVMSARRNIKNDDQTIGVVVYHITQNKI